MTKAVSLSDAEQTLEVVRAKRYASYPVYKNSGIDWLGNIPEYWNIKRLKFLTRINPSFSELNTKADSIEVSFVPMEAVNEYGGLRLDSEKTIREIKTGFTYFRNGDIVVAKITPCFENGKGSIAMGLKNGIAFGTTELHVIRPLDVLDGKFLFYLTISDHFRRRGAAEMYGAGGQKRVPTEFIQNFIVAFPKISEQKAIARFLEKETKKIDELIQAKRDLMDRLRDKRATLVHNAITEKGIKSERLAHIVDKIFRPVQRRDEDEYTPIGLYNWSRGIFHKEPTTGIDLGDSEFFWVRSGDLILSGQFAWEGAVAFADQSETGCVASHRFHILRGKKGKLDTAFLFALFTTKLGQHLLNDNSRGAAGRNRPLNIGMLLKEKIPIPTLNAQEKISELVYFERNFSAELKKSISQLTEYRTNLISAAVTGKIDIRGRGT